MRRPLVILAVPLLTVAAVLSAQRNTATIVPPQELARIWDAEHVSPPLPPLLEHAEVVQRLTSAVAGRLAVAVPHGSASASPSKAAPINLFAPAPAAFRVLLWSQMHGDEPTATAALFDVFEYLQRHRDDPVVQRILSSLTLYAIPMLNPDGAERFQRRNAQGIDINRDALRLQTPEGQVLKAVRDRVQAARRLQPAQPGLGHVGRRSAEAGVDLAAVGRLRRAALGQRRTAS